MRLLAPGFPQFQNPEFPQLLLRNMARSVLPCAPPKVSPLVADRHSADLLEAKRAAKGDGLVHVGGPVARVDEAAHAPRRLLRYAFLMPALDHHEILVVQDATRLEVENAPRRT